MKNILLTLLFIISFSYHAIGQVYSIDDVKKELDRIDNLDGDLDGIITLSNTFQTQRATQIFQTIPHAILSFIEKEQKGITYTRRVTKGLFEILSKVSSSDYFHLSYYEKLMTMAQSLVMELNDEVVLSRLKSDAKIAINLVEILKNRSFAKKYWLYTIKYYPTEVLTRFTNLYNEPYGLEIAEAVALDAPTVMKEYFGSNHLNYRVLKESKNPKVQVLFDIFKQHGSASKAYILINEIISGRLNVGQAHKIAANQDELFKKLIEIRKQPEIFGNYSVEKELEALSMEVIVEVNLRHDDNDAYRFQPVSSSSAIDIYTYIVYTPEEIFTSSFLGLYDRMMNKREIKSGYQFLENLNFYHFRVFLKQCAGYNKLDDFLGTMSSSEKELLINLLCKDLDKLGGNLGPAVDVADFYGSLNRVDLKTMVRNSIEKNLIDRTMYEDLNGMKIYGLLFKLMGGDPATYVWQFDYVLPLLDRVSHEDLFPNNKHMQLHYFYDDEDGVVAYNNFMSYFGADWTRKDKGNYVLLSSGKEKVMEIYVIKPPYEIAAREELKNLFDQNRRFPDLVVHRGHSYYVENTIAGLTNHTKIAILGSCGGYQNIAQAMENALDVQIISTKQIGTLAVNSALIFETIETIKKGKDIVWPELWKRVRARVGGNPRFNDYIPPHLNMGARFIKAFNQLNVN